MQSKRAVTRAQCVNEDEKVEKMAEADDACDFEYETCVVEKR